MEELKPGQFVVNEDGSINLLTHAGGPFHFTADAITGAGFGDAEAYAVAIRHTYTRLYPKSQGSEIKEEAPAFRIGGYYWSQGGDVMKITAHFNGSSSDCLHVFRVSRIGVKSGKSYEDDGARYADGSYFGDPSDEASLLPGELIERDGQWVRAEEGEGLGINGLTEAETSATASVMGIVAKSEPKRSPLPNSDAWRYTGKTFNRFAGFKVKSDTGWLVEEPSHPLQRMTEGTNPAHGSALLLSTKR